MTEIPMPGTELGYRAPGTRPFGLTLIMIIQTIFMLVCFGLGGLATLGYNFGFIFGGIILVFAGILFLFGVSGIRNNQSSGWYASVFANITHIGGYIYFALATGMPIGFGVFQMFISVVILIYLMLPIPRSSFGL